MYLNSLKICFIGFLFLSIMSGCGNVTKLTRPVVFKDDKVKHVRLKIDNNLNSNSNSVDQEANWIKTNIDLKKNDRILILVEGDNLIFRQSNFPIYRKTGNNRKKIVPLLDNIYQSKATASGNLLISSFTSFELSKTTQQNYDSPYLIDIFITSEADEIYFPKALERYAESNQSDKELQKNFQTFMQAKGNKLLKAFNDKINWDNYCGGGRLKGYLDFIKTFPKHPRILDALEGLNDLLLETYQKDFWDLDQYVEFDKDEQNYGGFWANTSNSETLNLFRKVADAGHSLADFILGDIYYLGVKQIDSKLAYEYALKSANQENLFGKFLLAKLYYLGIGVPKDQAHAQKIAAEILPELNNRYIKFQNNNQKSFSQQEQALVAYSLAWFYQKGLSVPKNHTFSKKLYAQSAKAGYIPAVYNLALVEIRNDAPSQHLQSSEYIIRNFAKKRFQRAQSNLAWMYQNNRNTGKNQQLALNWYQWNAESLWKWIQKNNKLSDCYQYIKSFPNSIHTEKVRQLISTFRKTISGEEEYQTLISNDMDLLAWKKHSENPDEWSNSNNSCAQFGDWRMPTIRELTYSKKKQPDLLQKKKYCSSDYSMLGGRKVMIFKNGDALDAAANAMCITYCVQTQIN